MNRAIRRAIQGIRVNRSSTGLERHSDQARELPGASTRWEPPCEPHTESCVCNKSDAQRGSREHDREETPEATIVSDRGTGWEWEEAEGNGYNFKLIAISDSMFRLLVAAARAVTAGRDAGRKDPCLSFCTDATSYSHAYTRHAAAPDSHGTPPHQQAQGQGIARGNAQVRAVLPRTAAGNGIVES
eukprot:gene14870-biopygen1084